jgi:uncharacterized SAM-binding protein YcdF (DUF218 family)
MKLLVLALIIIPVFTILGINSYLAPNDLAACGSQPTFADPCEKVDAIVAVSGGDTNARTLEAIKLYKAGWADLLIFSGAARDTSGPSNAEAMRRLAKSQGVPESNILVEEASATTRENAENTQALLNQYGIDSVIVVTSAYHQRRAGLEFSSRAATDVTVRNHPVETDRQWSVQWWLTPEGWFLAGSELVKIGLFYTGVGR